MYLGIDIGGTFTDLVLMDDAGKVSTAKALTTTGELEVGVFNPISLVAKNQNSSSEELLSKVKSFGHGDLTGNFLPVGTRKSGLGC